MAATSIWSEMLHVTTVPVPPPPLRQKTPTTLYRFASRAPYANQPSLADHGFCWKAALNVGSDCENWQTARAKDNGNQSKSS